MFFSPFGKVKSAALSTLQGTVLPVAIDFGASSLKVLQLQGGDPPQLIAAASLKTPDSLLNDSGKRFAFQFQALPKLIKAVGFKSRRAVVSLPAAQLFCKHLQLPKADNVSVAELVEHAVPAILECPSHALMCRHTVVEGASPAGQTSGMVGNMAAMGASSGAPGGGPAGGAKQEVICFAAARDFIGRVMQACKESRLELVGMHPEFLCTLRAFEHLSRRQTDSDAVTLYVDIAAGATKVLIANGDKLAFAKTVQFGGIDLDRAVAQALDCDLASARQARLESSGVVEPAASPAIHAATAARLRTNANDDGGVAVAEDRRAAGGSAATPGFSPELANLPQEAVGPADADLTEPLEILTDEIAMCVRYYESIFPGRKPTRCVFLGGESVHRGLCQHVARRLRLPAQAADPMARVARTGGEPVSGVDFKLRQPGWAVPLGLSLLPTDL